MKLFAQAKSIVTNVPLGQRTEAEKRIILKALDKTLWDKRFDGLTLRDAIIFAAELEAEDSLG